MMNENEIGKIIVDAAVTVHRKLGPGLQVGQAGTLVLPWIFAEFWGSLYERWNIKNN